MPQTAGNEKELVLGNKQLLGVFFVGTALCAVFFAMGYIVGRNSTKGLTPIATDSAASSTAAPVDTTHRQQPEPPRETAADPNAQIGTAPEQTAPAPEAAAEPAAERPKPAETPHAAEPEAATTGTFLQVAALPRADADNMLHSLREQKFQASLSPSPKDGYFRVLVGPYPKTADLAEAKSRLKTLGFGNAYVQRQ